MKVGRIGDEGKRRASEAVVKFGLRVLRRAKRLAPVDTGRLRSSIHIVDNTGVLVPPDGDSTVLKEPTEEGAVRIGTNVRYAPYIEFGTRHMAAQPFLRPALDEELSKQRRR